MGTHPIFESDFDCLTVRMDAVEKRAAGEVLSARDEQRLRNHQLRMMRRQYLKDMLVSPREPLYPQNNVQPGAGIRTRLANMKHGIQAYSAGIVLPKNRLWTFKAIFSNELFYGNLKNMPRLFAWSCIRFTSWFTVYFCPAYMVWTWAREQTLHGKWATFWGHFADILTEHTKMAAQCQVYPGDQTFTTRLRNVEWGHEGHNPFSIRNVHVPRMNPEAVTYPAGTRMNWVTWAPIMPEDDNQHDPDYGNGPGGKGQMSETYRLIHTTKQRGLYSRNPDDINTPASGFFSVLRDIMGTNYETDGGASRMKE